MCTQNGTKSSKTCTNTTTASTFGTFLASKCAAHLEPFSAYRILRNGHALYHAIDGSRKQIAREPKFLHESEQPPHVADSCSKCVAHLESKTVPNVHSKSQETHPNRAEDVPTIQVDYSLTAGRRKSVGQDIPPRKVPGVTKVRNLGSPGTFPGGPVGATSCAGLL